MLSSEAPAHASDARDEDNGEAIGLLFEGILVWSENHFYSATALRWICPSRALAKSRQR